MREEPPGLRSGLNREGLSGPRTSPRDVAGEGLGPTRRLRREPGEAGLRGRGSCLPEASAVRLTLSKTFPQVVAQFCSRLPRGVSS